VPILVPILVLGFAPGARAAGAEPRAAAKPAADKAVKADKADKGDRGDKADDADGDSAPEPGPSFEELASPARAIGEVGALLSPQIDKCPDDKREREIERVRCRATTSYLRRTLPGKTFSIASDDPAAISVSVYDQAIKGYRLALSACLACTNPIRVGRSEAPVFVTLKNPSATGKGGDSLAAAVEIASVSLP